MKKKTSPEISTSQTIRALVIEDSENDVVLLVRELKKGGFDPVYEQVQTAAAMKKALKEKEWDIILCDYNLPKFKGPSAITLLKEANIDIPVIIVSGTIGEEKAVECMRLGAQDYILKDNFSRLCPAIARELKELRVRKSKKQADAQKKAALEKLHHSEERYRKIARCSPDMIWTMDLSGQFTYVNEAVERTHGWTVDEFLKLNTRDVVSPQQFAQNSALIEGELSKAINPNYDRNVIFSYESEEVRKDGSTFWAEINAMSLWSDDGKPIGIIGITRDITERKQALEILQKSERQYRLLADNIKDFIWVMDLDLKFKYVSASVEKTSGYTEEEFKELSLDKILPEESLRKALEIFSTEESLAKANQLPSDRKRSTELEFRCKDGHLIWIDATLSFIRDANGKPISILGESRDITERKQAEKLLRERDERLQGITENLPGVIFQFYAKDNGEYGTSYISEPRNELAKIVPNMDTARMDTVFTEFISRIHEDDREEFLASIKTAVETGSRWNFEGRVSIPSDKMIWFQGMSSPTRLENQTIFDGVLLNITERKLAEEKSNLSEEKFHNIFMTTPNCIAITRLKDGLLVDVNRGFEDIVGWKREIAVGTKSTEPPMNFWVDSSARDFMAAKLKADREVLHREFEFRRADGSIRNGIYSARTINIGGEECLIFILLDITEQKQMDAELRHTLESLRNAVGTTIQVMISAIEMRDPYTAGHQSRVADIARAIATEMGLSQEKIDGIRMAGTIHDIGKLSIPAEILSKPTKLTPLEYSLIKEHAQNGFEMLQNVESPWPLAQIIYQHHERINGSGYPRNLKRNEIILEARILAVADVVEAMSSHRPYRASLGIEKALEEIENNKGTLYDEIAVSACLKLFREKGYQIP